DDERNAERAGEVRCRGGDPERLAEDGGIGVDEAAAAEARVEVQTAREAVDVVAAEGGAHLVEVLLRQLLRIVELVAVDEVSEAFHGAVHALGGRLTGPLRLVAAGDEARHHRAERPDAERGLHAGLRSASPARASAVSMARSSFCSSVPARPSRSFPPSSLQGTVRYLPASTCELRAGCAPARRRRPARRWSARP